MKKPKTLQPTAREIFGQNLRRARRLKDVSQEELAFQSELSRTYISEVERASRNISIDNMERLSKALAIPLVDLLNPDMFEVIQTRLG